MSHIIRSALVHYSPAEMYQLVNDVGDYASFLPWCRSSEVKSASATEMIASVEIAKGVLNKTFTTQNQLQKNYRIELQLVDGPFKKPATSRGCICSSKSARTTSWIWASTSPSRAGSTSSQAVSRCLLGRPSRTSAISEGCI